MNPTIRPARLKTPVSSHEKPDRFIPRRGNTVNQIASEKLLRSPSKILTKTPKPGGLYENTHYQEKLTEALFDETLTSVQKKPVLTIKRNNRNNRNNSKKNIRQTPSTPPKSKIDLDASGLINDAYSNPISWSPNNQIAIPLYNKLCIYVSVK